MTLRSSSCLLAIVVASASACSASTRPSHESDAARGVGVVLSIRDHAAGNDASSIVVVLGTPVDGREATAKLEVGGDLVEVRTSFVAYLPPNDSVVALSVHRTGAHPVDAKLLMTPGEAHPNFDVGAREFPFHAAATYALPSPPGFSSEIVSYGLLVPEP